MKGEHIRLTIEGMKCDACAANVVAAIRRVVGANDAIASYASKTAVVVVDTSINLQELITAIESAGPYLVRDPEGCSLDAGIWFAR
jgi:copper chaperone CopZ